MPDEAAPPIPRLLRGTAAGEGGRVSSDDLAQLLIYLSRLPGGGQVLKGAINSIDLDELGGELARGLILRMPRAARKMWLTEELQETDPYERNFWLWVAVVVAFAAVMVITSLALSAVLVWGGKADPVAPQNPVAPQIGQMVLAVFTTAVGFLSGLAIPSPFGRPPPGPPSPLPQNPNPTR